MREYIVQRGDTLMDIAREVLGDAQSWHEIAQLNFIHEPRLLFVGQRLKLPERHGLMYGKRDIQKPLCVTGGTHLPASLALARGFMFVVFEQLPEFGGSSLIRKLEIIPYDFSLQPLNPLGNLSLAEHALGGSGSQSQLLSASTRPFGAANMNGQPLLLDVAKIERAGGKVYSVPEVVNDLKRFATENPHSRAQVNKLISIIQDVEGEVLIEGGAPPGAVRQLSTTHKAYVHTAEDLWKEYARSQIPRGQLVDELSGLEKAYTKARGVGRVGRVLTVIGVVFTAADLGMATKKSIDQKSFRPIAAESIRQAGGWGGALAGAKFGVATGALFGIETGPGAIVTGAVGAIIFGAVGYFSADWLADHISPN